MAPNHPCQSPPEPGWMASSPLQKGFEDMNCQAGPNRKVPRISAKPTTVTAPAPQRAAGSLSSLPQRACSRSSRAIQYILLDSCRNIPAPHGLASKGSHRAQRGSASCHPINHVPSTTVGCCPPVPSYLSVSPTFLSLPRKLAHGSGHSLDAWKRLPVFLQLCGEDVPTTASKDARLQTSSHERKEQPNAKAPREGKRGQRMKKMVGCTPCDKA
ncbi:uncharacterized protein LOC110407698 [Numida meleagris]|uniref:uncharacterized protein LOC110407698 n=1 Tax=Numida meleagris TaxID=8996 RepID=UPI000B3DB6F9|nr:uncharacterized protein LOC110407698 [Numida meleagris]